MSAVSSAGYRYAESENKKARVIAGLLGFLPSYEHAAGAWQAQYEHPLTLTLAMPSRVLAQALVVRILSKACVCLRYEVQALPQLR